MSATIAETIDRDKIPEALIERDQWVLWKTIVRNDDPTKVPFTTKGSKAKADDPATWTTFKTVWAAFEGGGYSGVGYEFFVGDPFVGIDLDNCRNPGTGEVAKWAHDAIAELDTYCEVSPSGHGFKLWLIGKSPFDKGRHVKLKGQPEIVEGKLPAIEIYDHARFFAVTGWRVDGPSTPQERQDELESVARRLIPARPIDSPQSAARSPMGRSGNGRLSVVERAARYVATMPGAVSGQGGHNQTFAVACALVIDFDLSPDDAWPVMAEYNARCKPEWSERELRHKLESASQQPGERGKLLNAPLNGRGGGHASNGTAARSDRPQIVLGPDESRVTDQAIAALADTDGIYQRGGSLVHIVSDAKAPSRIERPAGSLRIVRMPEPRLGEIMGDAADWFRVNKGAGGKAERVPVHPPDRIVRKVEARGQWRGIPPIEQVVEVPVFLPDGSILTAPGFNDQHGLFFAPSITFPEPIAEPTREDAEWAAGVLLEPVVDVPFKTDAHAAAWLAAMLTPFARQAYAGPTPLIVVDANVPGAGKGLAVDVIARAFTGRQIARSGNPRDDTEARKLITSIALAGEPMLLFDNVSGRLGCSALDAALTATSWKERILGRTEMTGSLPLATVWFATANNIILGSDTARRTLHIRLEFLGESPEERCGFKYPDLPLWVAQHRGELAIAAVTILRAYHLAGRPNMGLPPWGSFEGWSGLVRSAVAWAGMPDPALTREELSQQSDGEATLLSQLLDGWAEIDPAGRGKTVAEAFVLLKEHPEGYPRLRAALMNLPSAKGDNLPSRQSVGMKIHHWQRRVIGGRYFDRKPTTRGGASWEVKESEPVHD